MRSLRRWFADLIGKVDEAREDDGGGGFTAEVVGAAQMLTKIERDPLYPGYWHVVEPYGPKKGQYLEFRVQTDEWIENGSINWATCNCPEGRLTQEQVSRCPHVAAVLLAMVEELNR